MELPGGSREVPVQVCSGVGTVVVRPDTLVDNSGLFRLKASQECPGESLAVQICLDVVVKRAQINAEKKSCEKSNLGLDSIVGGGSVLEMAFAWVYSKLAFCTEGCWFVCVC